MKSLIHLAAIAGFLFAPATYAQEYQTGLAPLQVQDSQTQRPLVGFIWYPTEQTAPLSEHHSNPVWIGIQAIELAKVADGKHPLIVLSHGMYGNAMNQSWLAAELAQQGFVVAAINHPGTSTWLRDPEDSRQMWQRPKDISRVIDHFLNTSESGIEINPDQIFMAGHSLGGFTAVALAGGRYDATKFDTLCEEDPEELVCNIFSKWKIAETPEDKIQMQTDLSDPRIAGFAVFDLGGTQTFSQASLGEIKSPMLIMGAPRDISGLDLDTESRALVAALPPANVTYLEPVTLSHFDFLGECKPMAMEILASEEPGDEFICMQGGKERRADHQMILETITAFFNQN